jgi:glycine oxidase
VNTFDVAIVGGGLIGAAAALELCARRLSVVLLDRQQPGREASWAAAGMLAPGPDDPRSTPAVALARESFRLYPEFVAAIERASGKSTGFQRRPTLQVFFGPSGESECAEFIAAHRRFGLSAEVLSLQSAREMEPSVGSSASAVVQLDDEATVDPRLLMDALIAAASAAGADIRANCAVTDLLGGRGRCLGVATEGGPVAARHVVLAAGCFSRAAFAEVAHCAPTRPVRGQMLALRHPNVKLDHVLRSARGYLVPRADGRIVAGSTLEDAGFEKMVTPEGVRQIMSAAVELVPALADAEVVETWAGLRPGTPDDLPILGTTGIEGLLVATGHYRNGILLAPVTAKLVGAWISGDSVVVDARAFSPLRFEERAASGPAD